MSRQEEEYNIRKRKAEVLRSSGHDPYPAEVTRSHAIREAVEGAEQLLGAKTTVDVVGRIRAIRGHGGSTFATIDDGSATIQAYFKKDILQEAYQIFVDQFDMGDFISVSGTLFHTKRGELTIQVEAFHMLSKALLPMPEKWHGLTDTEIRYRKRYLDLLSNPDVRHIFTQRSKLIQTLRQVATEAGFLEVETPMLQPIPGGANAKPFITHHNALDTDLYLRVAPELYLKRLIVGGYEKVFEIARCFRNEGIDRDHNPEFTQIEMYAAYWDYERMMSFTEGMFRSVAQALHGGETVTYQGEKINFSPAFARLTFHDAILEHAGIDIDSASEKELRDTAGQHSVEVAKDASHVQLLDELFKHTVRQNIVQPTFIMDYPVALSPLAKKKPDNPEYVERFQLLAGRTELCNAFSELNDPLDQRDRFQAQETLRKAGDDEAQRIDEDYIEALAHGMPPTAGIGIGIDRLTALMLDAHNLKEVILFPTLKPEQLDENTR